MAETQHKLPPAIAQFRLVILASYYGLVGYFLLSSILYFQALTLAAISIWIIQVIPLLLFAPGLHRTNLRTYAWMCFVVLLYFTHGVLVAFDPSRMWLGIVQVTLCVILFCCLILFIRAYRDHFKVGL